jgi:hypothetical protein
VLAKKPATPAQKRYMALYLCESRALERRRGDFAHLELGKGCVRFKSMADLPVEATRALLAEAAEEARQEGAD